MIVGRWACSQCFRRHAPHEKYQGKVLVIKGKEILGVYDTPLEAYLETQKRYEPGTDYLAEANRIRAQGAPEGNAW